MISGCPWNQKVADCLHKFVDLGVESGFSWNGRGNDVAIRNTLRSDIYVQIIELPIDVTTGSECIKQDTIDFLDRGF